MSTKKINDDEIPFSKKDDNQDDNQGDGDLSDNKVNVKIKPNTDGNIVNITLCSCNNISFSCIIS